MTRGRILLRAGMVAVLVAALLGLGEAAEPGGGASAEGIKVHGDWTIEVRNPDGSLVSRHEFKNALVPGQGDAMLAQLLGRTLPAFTWGVEIGEWSDSGGPCVPQATPPNGMPCLAFEPGLTVTVTGAATLELSGLVTARQPASLGRVATRIFVSQAGPRLFTEKQLSPPIPVSAGQIIQFKVVFSFS